MRPAAAIALLLAAALLGGCSAGGDDGGDPTLTVYVSLPMRGALAADGRDAADGARLALADAGGEAGGTVVEGIYLDDTAGSGARARWSPVSAAANARRATQDATAIAYLGDFESGALAPRCRSPTPPGSSRFRRRAPRVTSSPRRRAPTMSPGPNRVAGARSPG